MKNNCKLSAAVCTLGCKVNQYESDCIISEFIRLGFDIKNFDEVCSVYVVNTCAVTAQSEKKSRQMIRRAKKLNSDAVIAVCGCFSQLNPKYLKNQMSADIIAGTTDKLKIPQTAYELVKNRYAGGLNFVRDISEHREYENISTATSEKTRAYIKIQDGCNAKCSYCVIPLARGRAVSRHYDDILDEVKRFNDMGFREIVFAGIEIASYGTDLKNIDLISLLERLDNEPSLGNIISMRLSSLDPSYITKKFTDRFAKLKKSANHFHVSLQSGSDRILNLMRRKYNTERVIENLGYAKKMIPDLNLTADIIVGFPTETNEDFQMSVDIIKKINVYHTHIFTYSKRPDTEAANFSEQVEENVKNIRSRKLYEECKKIKYSILKNIANSTEKCYDVIIEDLHSENNEKYRKYYYTAKTKNYIDTKISADKAYLDDIQSGSVKTVRVTSCDDNFLLCEFV